MASRSGIRLYVIDSTVGQELITNIEMAKFTQNYSGGTAGPRE